MDISLTTLSVGAGISYQWEASLDNENWNEITGQNSLTLAFTDVQTVTTYYRAVITSEVISQPPQYLINKKISLSRTANPLNVGETDTYTEELGPTQ